MARRQDHIIHLVWSPCANHEASRTWISHYVIHKIIKLIYAVKITPLFSVYRPCNIQSNSVLAALKLIFFPVSIGKPNDISCLIVLPKTAFVPVPVLSALSNPPWRIPAISPLYSFSIFVIIIFTHFIILYPYCFSTIFAR